MIWVELAGLRIDKILANIKAWVTRASSSCGTSLSTKRQTDSLKINYCVCGLGEQIHFHLWDKTPKVLIWTGEEIVKLEWRSDEISLGLSESSIFGIHKALEHQQEEISQRLLDFPDRLCHRRYTMGKNFTFIVLYHKPDRVLWNLRGHKSLQEEDFGHTRQDQRSTI